MHLGKFCKQQWFEVPAVLHVLVVSVHESIRIGVMPASAVQLVRPDAVGAAQGLLGWVSYMGAACAGAPLALAVQKYGWNVYFTSMIAAAGLLCVLVLPMVNAKSYAQRMAEESSLDSADGSLDATQKS